MTTSAASAPTSNAEQINRQSHREAMETQARSKYRQGPSDLSEGSTRTWKKRQDQNPTAMKATALGVKRHHDNGGSKWYGTTESATEGMVLPQLRYDIAQACKAAN